MKDVDLKRYLVYICLVWFSCTLMIDINGQGFHSDLEEIRVQNNLIGMAVGVQCGSENQELYFGGQADIGSNIELDENTMFRVASISKSFSAAGLMTLYDAGLFELDDDISEGLGYEVRNPDFPNVPITYRMLLSHQSSLQDGSGYSPFLSATYSADPIPPIYEVLLESGEYYTSDMWRTESPGTHFAYSNINYGLIGTLIEALSNERFDEYMRDHILLPLGINGGYNVAELQDIQNLAVLYRDNVPQADNYGGVNPEPIITGIYVPGTNGSLFAPQGGLRCTLSDLLSFASMINSNGLFGGQQVLSPEAIEEMISIQWDYNGSNGDNYFGLFNRWGLGLHFAGASGLSDHVIEDHILIGHPGEAYGLISDLYFDPESGFALAFLTNGYSSGGGYSFGVESNYYTPEEESFDVIENYYWNDCQSLSTSDQELDKNLCNSITISSKGILEIPNPQSHKITVDIFGMNGKKLNKMSGQSRMEVELPYGISVVRIAENDKACSQKVHRTY